MKAKYTQFKYDFTGSFAEVEESYGHLGLPYHAGKSKRKVLYVLDFVPTEDLRSGRLLSGQTGDLLNNILVIAKEIFLKNVAEVDDFSWLAMSFNAFKTLGKPKEFQAQAREVFAKRVKAMVVKYKPDTVVLFGQQPMRALMPKKVELSNGTLSHWLGVPLPKKFSHGGASHKCSVVSTISLNSIVMGDSSEGSMLGYMGRNLANAITNTHHWAIDAEEIDAHESILINTVAKFDKLMDMLEAHMGPVAIDTETLNLNRVTNRLLTIQFAKCLKYGYLLPIYHKDTPFIASELKYIKKRLRAYFEGRNKNAYHIYANAQFDLNVLRTNLETAFMANDVWDIFAGEFCFHPDTYVSTEIGPIQIRFLVNAVNPPRVWSFNHATGKPELKKILAGSSHKTTDRMMRIGYGGSSVRVTENHKVWSVTRGCYIEAKHIRPGEEIEVLEGLPS